VKGGALQDRANFLAGIASPNSSISLQNSAIWREHRNELTALWARADEERLNTMRYWATAELQPLIYRPPALFYMFGGPDFLTAETLYPALPAYILVGLEPVGEAPPIESLQPEQVVAGLKHLRESLDTSLKFGYFITKDMQADLTRGPFTGVTPLLYVFLARAGKKIISQDYVSVTSQGALTTSLEPYPAESGVAGIRITFVTPGMAQRQELFYFRANLANSGLQSNPGFLRYLESYGKSASFLKAASYLMHTGEFSSIRNFLLENSTSILQDDSGIPFRALADPRWQLHYFGRYTGTLEIFEDYYQPELAAAFRSAQRLPLSFGAGYKFRQGESHLLLAVLKRPAQRQAEAQPAPPQGGAPIAPRGY
jgi:hypothetical protein